jgi:hypothetical protein
VEEGIAAATEFARDRDVDVAGGQIGSQALELGLIDQVVVNLVPVVFGLAGRSSPPAASRSRCCSRIRRQSWKATGSRTSSTTSAAEAGSTVATGCDRLARRRSTPSREPCAWGLG